MTTLSRRALLASLTAAAVSSQGPAGAVEMATDTAGLRDHAARAGMIYGASIASDGVADPDARAVYERETRIITPDLELKFAVLRPDRDTFRFGPADTIVDWARGKGMLVRGHTLVWNEYNGDWLNRCSSREVTRIFDEHIETVVTRYAGKIHTWDVINEPFWPDHGERGGYRQGPWYNAIGPSYIPRALKRVRALDPKAKLCINEAWCEIEDHFGDAIRPCLQRLVGDLRDQGVPLDAVGLQCHLQPSMPHNDAHFADYLRGLGKLGVELHISEFDVNDASFPDGISIRDQMVAARASAFLAAVLAVPEVKMLINWELIDKLSGYEHDALNKDPHAKRLPRPLPYDDNYQRKPLWSAIAQAFDNRAKA